MAEGKNPQLASLEQSLINFLTSKKDIEDKVNGGAKRVRALTFNIDMHNAKNPVFTVQIGMCEAAFDCRTGLKSKGNCFGLERYIRDWFERPAVTNEINTFISSQKKD